MTVEIATRTIQLMLAPVVMISACAILVSGMLTRYALINERMRTMARERLDLLRMGGATLVGIFSPQDPFIAERLQQIDKQAPELLRRHMMMHNAVLTLYLAILLYVLSMVMIAGAAIQFSVLATGALIILLLGTFVMLGSVMMVAIEISVSQRSVTYEVERVLSLGRATN